MLADPNGDIDPAILKLANYLAGRLAPKLGRFMDREEIASVAAVAGLEAKRRFRPELGVRLTSFVQRRMRGAVYDVVRGRDWFSGGLARRGRSLRQLPIVARPDIYSRRLDADNLNGKESLFYHPAFVTLDPEDALDAFRHQVRRLIPGLSRLEYSVLLSYFYHGLTMKETGEIHGKSESRVSQIITQLIDRARERHGRQRVARTVGRPSVREVAS
ncbi:MAG TPA: sigma-70 family RNA polymerase sigma factor [Gemmata sp.]|jgi:RNA polymerase sigma factor for flagellar operon FliA|nr:sigma-70 family RNA polymerase sigma factor [Gemmata sp.]